MPKFYVKYSSSVEVEADNEVDAIKQAQKLAHVCAMFCAYQIGVDVDDLGWPIKKTEKQS